jgi:DNA-binding transcriptional MerR regulator
LNHPQTWKIGDLAKQTGLSIRTLHYYEEIGLLAASMRTEGGHRVYTEDDLTRLQRILSLRQLGFTLDDIQGCLDRPEFALAPLIDLQLTRLEDELALKQRIHARLTSLRQHLVDGRSIPVTQMIEALEAMTMLETYLTPEEIRAVQAAHAAQSGPDSEDLPQRWKDLYAAVTEHMAQGDDPTSPPVLALAERWRALVDQSTRGDAKLARSVAKMYREQPEARQRVGMSNELWEYITRALAVNPNDRGW